MAVRKHWGKSLLASGQKCHMDNTDIKAVAKEFAERNANRTAYFADVFGLRFLSPTPDLI